MIVRDICYIVEGEIVCGSHRLAQSIEHGFASDLMSDVLTVKQPHFLLITGLANVHLMRTAEMSDVWCMLICRGKKTTEEMIALAKENDMVVIESPLSMFTCSGLLYQAGLKDILGESSELFLVHNQTSLK